MKTLKWRNISATQRYAEGYWPGWEYQLVKLDNGYWEAWFIDAPRGPWNPDTEQWTITEYRYRLCKGNFIQARAAAIAHHNHK